MLAAVGNVIGSHPASAVIPVDGRASRFAEVMRAILDEARPRILADYGIDLVDVRLRQLTLPSSASADRENKINEARTYANTVLPKARGEAQSLVLAAQSYREQRVAEAVGNTARFLELLAEYSKAPEITRSRLCLEAMEKILPRVKKYVIDSEQGRQPLNLRLSPPRP